MSSRIDPRQDTWFNALTATARECEQHREISRAQRHRDSRWEYYDQWIATGANEIADRALRRGRA